MHFEMNSESFFSCVRSAAVSAAALVFGALALLSVPTAQAQIFPLSENTWDNPEFVKRFLGSYGVHTRVEPEISREEGEFFSELVDIIPVNPRRAIESLRQKITPDSSAALDYTLASLLLQQGDLNEAVRHYERAIRKFPNFMRAYKNLGLALLQINRFEEAIEHIVKAIELGDGDGDTFGLLGFAYLNIGKPKSALDAYRMAYVLRPNNRDWKVGKAQALSQTGSYEQSAAILKELIEANPNDRNFWLSRANALISLGLEQEAAAHLELVKRMGRADAASLKLLGDIYMNDQVFPLALANYKAAIERDARLPVGTAVTVSRNLTRFAAFEQADSFIHSVFAEYADELTDAQRATLLNLQAEIALGTGDDARAAEILEEVVAADPLNGEALILLGNYYFRQGEFEQADFFYERARNIPDHRAEALVQQARMRVAQREYGEAVRFLEEAQSIRPRRNVENFLVAVRNAYESTR